MKLTIFKLVTAVAFLLEHQQTAYGNGNSTCSMEMFGNDTSAYYACKAQFALQSNWFPSPIAGLFSYEIWNGFDGFWQNGALLETMVNFIAYANHTRYINVVRESYRELYSLMEAYGPYPSFDDMGWYGLSYLRIYEILGIDEFKQCALDILNWAWETGWDVGGTCHEGFWFDNLMNLKATITNVQMMNVAAKLYRVTKDKNVLHKLNKIYTYIYSNGLVNGSTYLLTDNIDENCTVSDTYNHTYLSGVFIGGLVELYKIYNKTDYLDLAQKVATASIHAYSNETGIFTEPCDPNCGDDNIMYKGIFVRNLRYLMDEMKDKPLREQFQKWLEVNVNGIMKYSMCDKVPISKCNITLKDGPSYFNISGPVFSPDWNGPFRSGAPMQQTSALDLFVSAIKPGTSCVGKFCTFDPNYPPPQALTCGSHPCPSGEDCCEYSPYTSYTCCETSQKCNKTQGVCV